MPFQCAICTDHLERSPPDELGDLNGSKISATRCGHLFHTFCLNSWMNGNSLNNRECPNCREFVRPELILRFYPTICEDSVLMDLNSNPHVNRLEDEIATKDLLIAEFKEALQAKQEEIGVKSRLIDHNVKQMAELKNQLKMEREQYSALILTFGRFQQNQQECQAEVEQLRQSNSELKHFKMKIQEALMENDKSTSVKSETVAAPGPESAQAKPVIGATVAKGQAISPNQSIIDRPRIAKLNMSGTRVAAVQKVASTAKERKDQVTNKLSPSPKRQLKQ